MMALTALVAAVVIAQAPQGWTASVIVEPARESLRYRFDNPSSYDTAELVPHFFEQTYDTRNVWAGVRVTYPLLRRTAETRFTATPAATRRADDFDTFFQPDGNVVVAGTTGTASVRSWHLSQRIGADRVRGMDVGVTFGYRRDTFRYDDGIGIVTTTLPRTEQRRLVTTREFVTSQLLEAGVFAAGSRSSFTGSVDLIVVGVGRLAIELPDKYPGQTIIASGRYSAAVIEGNYSLRAGPATVRLGLRAGASLPWQRTSAMHLRRTGLFVAIGFPTN